MAFLLLSSPFFKRVDMGYYEKQKLASSRNPEIYERMSEWISEKLADFGETNLGYNPVIPVPFQVWVDRDRKFLTLKS